MRHLANCFFSEGVDDAAFPHVRIANEPYAQILSILDDQVSAEGAKCEMQRTLNDQSEKGRKGKEGGNANLFWEKN